MELKPCPDCGQQISPRAVTCCHCGCPTDERAEVNARITDLDISFRSMIVLMVKATFAAIPAAIAIGAIVIIAAAMFGGVFRIPH